MSLSAFISLSLCLCIQSLLGLCSFFGPVGAVRDVITPSFGTVPCIAGGLVDRVGFETSVELRGAVSSLPSSSTDTALLLVDVSGPTRSS